MKKGCFAILIAVCMILILSCSENPDGTGKNASEPALSGKKILMVIAPKDFRDEELFTPKGYLEKCGAKVDIASSVTETVTGMKGGTIKPALLLKDADASLYDAIVFIGGSGSKVYFDDALAQGIALKAVENGKVVAAICLAPSILANAHILHGKKATVFTSESDNLKAKGAIYEDASVVKDGMIVTANGPDAALEFARVIAELLSKAPVNR